MSAAAPPLYDPVSHIDTSWFRLYHDVLYLPYHALFTLGFSLRIQGTENMPPTGPAVIVANHQSFFDPLLIGLAAHRPLVYLARKTLFRNKLFGSIIRFMCAVPVDQQGIGLDGIRTILDQIERGRPVVIFPEGSRTPNGDMLPLMPGIHLLIRRTGVPVVPVGISGAYDAWPVWRTMPIPAPLFWPGVKGTISVSMGKPVDSDRFAKMKRPDALRVLGEMIQTEKDRAESLRRRTSFD